MKKYVCLLAVCFLAACATAPRLATNKNFKMLCAKPGPALIMEGSLTYCSNIEKDIRLSVWNIWLPSWTTPEKQKQAALNVLENDIQQCQEKDGCKYEVLSCPNSNVRAVVSTLLQAPLLREFRIIVPSKNADRIAVIQTRAATIYSPQDVFPNFCSLTPEKLPGEKIESVKDGINTETAGAPSAAPATDENYDPYEPF